MQNLITINPFDVKLKGLNLQSKECNVEQRTLTVSPWTCDWNVWDW